MGSSLRIDDDCGSSLPLIGSTQRTRRASGDFRPLGSECEADDRMLSSIVLFYLFLKLVFFYSLVRIQVRFDTMKDHWLFLGMLYTGGIAFLSYVFLFSWQDYQWPNWHVRVARNFGVSPWVAWLAETLLLSTLYFRLLSKFDEGVIFWTLLLLGVLFVWF